MMGSCALCASLVMAPGRPDVVVGTEAARAHLLVEEFFRFCDAMLLHIVHEHQGHDAARVLLETSTRAGYLHALRYCRVADAELIGELRADAERVLLERLSGGPIGELVMVSGGLNGNSNN